MGCTANKAEDVDGCQHCVFHCLQCSHRVYACTSLKRCIHCGASSSRFRKDNFFDPYDSYSEKRRDHILIESFSGHRVLSLQKRKEIDRCAWCFIDDTRLVKVALQAVDEANKIKKRAEKNLNDATQAMDIANQIKEQAINNIIESKRATDEAHIVKQKATCESKNTQKTINDLTKELKNKTDELNKMQEQLQIAENYVVVAQPENQMEGQPNIPLPGSPDPDKWRAPGGPKIVYLD